MVVADTDANETAANAEIVYPITEVTFPATSEVLPRLGLRAWEKTSASSLESTTPATRTNAAFRTLSAVPWDARTELRSITAKAAMTIRQAPRISLLR